MINKDLLHDIQTALSQTDAWFTNVDFNIASESTKRLAQQGTALTIVYTHLAGCEFHGFIPNRKSKIGEYNSDFSIAVTVRPGEALHEEHFDVVGIPKMLEAIREWLGRIKAELRAIPLAREVERQRKHIDEMAAQLADQADQYLTREEADALRDRLTQLEDQLVAAANQATKDAEERKKETAAIHNEIEALRNQVATFTKGGIVRRIFAALYRLAQNPNVQKLALDAAEKGVDKFLPPHHGG